MKNLTTASRKFFTFPGVALLLSLILGVCLSWLVISLLQTSSDARGRTELNLKLDELKEYLSISTMRNRAISVALLYGLSEPLIKQAVSGEMRLDDEEVLQRLRIARNQFGFESMYVINTQGLVIADDTD